MGKTLMFLNPRKRKGRRSSARRRTHRKHKMFSNPRKGRKRSSGRRRGGARRGFSLGGIGGSVKSAFNKDIVMTGLGLFAAQTTLSVVWAKYGPRLSVDKNGAMLDVDGNVTTDKTKQAYVATLPLATSPIGGLLYGIGIPIAVGILARRISPSLSTGAYLAGISGMINTYLGPTVRNEIASIKSLQPASAYLRAGNFNVAGVGRIIGRPRLAPVGNLPGFPAIFPTNSMARR